jgi:uncharacterized protein
MTPLHTAVIEDQLDSLKNKAFIDQWRDVSDSLGFTALEIAKLLGKYEAILALGEEIPSSFKLQPEGLKNPLMLSLKGFEKALGFTYRPYLTFPSYSFLKQMVRECPYILRSSRLASDNYAWTHTYKNELGRGKTESIFIKWIDPILGYGVFAEKEIPYGSFVGEYTGIVRRLFRGHPDQNPYCLHYPTKLWSLKYCVVDAFREGNLTRFINHSSHPNLQPICLVEHGLLHQVFIANRVIKPGEQLTFDYGKDFWAKRKKMTTV